MAGKITTQRSRTRVATVKEHPIAMAAWSMRRILAGAKTQTRRVMKPQPTFADRSGGLGKPAWRWSNRKGSPGFYWNEGESPHPSIVGYSPFGSLGDLLWVREPLVKSVLLPESEIRPLVRYEADREFPLELGLTVPWPWKRDRLPAIFCPRWASRMTVRVKNVEVERIQDIKLLDVIAEGWPKIEGDLSMIGLRIAAQSRMDGFQRLWNKLNAKRGFGWAANPWVWATEFEVVE